MKKLKIASVIIFAVCIAVVFILRGVYMKDDGIIAEALTLYGIENGVGIACGESADGVFVSVPTEMSVKDIVSVSSDPNIAYLKLNKDEPYNVRVIKAEVVSVSPGIAELYVTSPDGKYVSERFTVNCYSSEESVTTAVTESQTAPVTSALLDCPVYVTPSGTKYHLDRSCAGSTAYAVELESAVSEYLPCKKCATK